ncbi:MAG: peptide MFS transporter [Prevotellaceae bacterium]|jgi:POT family proton-dependent oligopeptide transporter|nr:peptide MFS transporter [Prevotellaceae bacterium]
MFKNHPKGLLGAALSNMGERFGYYIMNAVLVLFLCSKFGLDEGKSALIYSFFYAGIYILSLVGGITADKLKNYKGTIMSGLIIMASGYAVLSIPILSTADNIGWLLPLTCVALFLIAFGNGLFKGNLQAIVGQMYNNLEKEAEQKGAEALEKAKAKRNPGFQIFYVFINIGGFIAPFVAPLLRGWWLEKHFLKYNAGLPELCHKFLKFGEPMVGAGATPEEIGAGITHFNNLTTLAPEVTQVGASVNPANLTEFCSNYLDIFNTGVHYSFIASVVAMLISLFIFIASKKILPNPEKQKKKENRNYTAEEKREMAREIRQRIYALFAVLGIVVFFWFSFHQNGASLSVFAKDFVITSTVPAEVWQAINPFFVITLTPIIMLIFGRLRAKQKIIEIKIKKTGEIKKIITNCEPSTPKKIAIGMGIAAIAFLFLAIISHINDYPSAAGFKEMAENVREGMKSSPWVLIVLYFFLTVAELFISPLGISFVSKVAPENIQGLCQGLWLGATAVGNGFLWVGTYLYNTIPIEQCWFVFVILCITSMVVMLSMVKWIEKITSEKAEVAK